MKKYIAVLIFILFCSMPVYATGYEPDTLVKSLGITDYELLDVEEDDGFVIWTYESLIENLEFHVYTQELDGMGIYLSSDYVPKVVKKYIDSSDLGYTELSPVYGYWNGVPTSYLKGYVLSYNFSSYKELKDISDEVSEFLTYINEDRDLYELPHISNFDISLKVSSDIDNCGHLMGLLLEEDTDIWSRLNNELTAVAEKNKDCAFR